MRPLLSIISVILLSLMSFSVYGQDLRDKKDTVQKILPGVQWDTTVKVLPVKYPEHLIGVRYDFSFTGVSMTPDMGIKSINSPFNIAVLYTYYHPLWGAYDFFGLQTGLRYSKYGFVNDEYQFEHFEQTVTFVELPFLSAFHVDLGEHFRILISLGPFVGYRFAWQEDRVPSGRSLPLLPFHAVSSGENEQFFMDIQLSLAGQHQFRSTFQD